MKDKGPARLIAPEMPALASLDRAIAGAVLRAWNVPAGTQAGEWLIQLPAGQSPDVLRAIGATEFRAVPFWDNAYSVKFGVPQDIGGFPATVSGVTESEFYYPVLPLDLERRFIPNDTLFSQQWHLRNTGQSGGTVGGDANVETAWDILGDDNQPVRRYGVLIGIIDDSLQRTHPDLSPANSAANRYDDVDDDADPSPFFSDDNHGTSVAGVAAARGEQRDGRLGGGTGRVAGGDPALGMVGNGTDIELTNRIAQFKAASIDIGLISTPSAGAIVGSGNFLADLTVSGNGELPGKPALMQLKVGGNILDSDIRVGGNANLLRGKCHNIPNSFVPGHPEHRELRCSEN